jgi:hypothetical protein
MLTRDGTTTLAGIVDSAKLPVLRVRQAQFGTGASTRFIGLSSASLSAAPANGIYFRHAVTANYIAVCRAASTESVLDTGVAAANGVFHDLEIRIESASLARVFVDGVEKGTITSNIPTALLGIGAGHTSVANSGQDVNLLAVSQKM